MLVLSVSVTVDLGMKCLLYFDMSQVSELQRLDNQYKDQITLAITMAEKLVSGKVNRQQYLDSETSINSKREDIYQKMEALRATL